MELATCNSVAKTPWNKAKIVGQTPFKLKEIWAIRVRLQLADYYAAVPSGLSRSSRCRFLPSDYAIR